MGRPSSRLLRVRGLKVLKPGGEVLIEDLSLEVRPGEIAVLLGGSGAGKSTFARVLFERHVLEQQGFRVRAEQLEFDERELGLVPQRGALFDHLDVRENLELAMRYAPRDTPVETVGTWLERVGLDDSFAEVGVPVGSLSGGQAQRVAVARVLAGGRRILILDEPSVGLDPHHVRVLARLLRAQCERLGVAMIVVTHDVALAGGVADRLFMLDAASRRLTVLFEGEWPGAMERPSVEDGTRGHWLLRLENEVVTRIDRSEEQLRGGPARSRAGEPTARARHLVAAFFRPLGMAMVGLAFTPLQLLRRPGDFSTIARRVARQTLLRPLLFYAIVSILIGYTILYVISQIGGAGVRADALLKEIGGSYVVALAPALAAILFVAASGSATNAWLGSIGLTKQAVAMEALGVDTRAYLTGPTWLSLALCFHAVAIIFALGMLLGGLILCLQMGVSGGWDLLTADLIDPRPERTRYALRAGFLAWTYGWGIASDVVAKGMGDKRSADDVTRGMTSSVVACTLWVVTWELASVIVVFTL